MIWQKNKNLNRIIFASNEIHIVLVKIKLVHSKFTPLFGD